MEESTDQTPKPNEFVISKFKAYAMTDVEIWEVAEYLMTKLEPVQLEELDPEDRECTICQEEFLDSEDGKPSHDPVRVACGHVFGRKCIIRWLDPLCSWGLLRAHFDAHPHAPLLGKPGCPVCRRVFFPRVFVEPVDLLVCRLAFWDLAYASAGVARSEKEERSRKYLWQYVGYCCSIDENEPNRQLESHLLRPAYTMPYLYKEAQSSFLSFVKSLKSQTLTPEQETLRKSLGQLGRRDLNIYPVKDDSSVLNTDCDDEEQAEYINGLLELAFRNRHRDGIGN